MGIQKTPIPQHWNYFLSLEEDVSRLSRYVEFTEENFDTYSLELARILFSAASEIDVVAKRLCNQINGKSKAERITDYRKIICSAFPLLANTNASIPRFGLNLTPWEEWQKDSNPFWWKAYTNVKHHRDTNFPDASLKNALNSVAALFILLIFFYREESRNARLTPDPTLFQIGAPFTIDYPAFGPRAIFYQLQNDPPEEWPK